MKAGRPSLLVIGVASSALFDLTESDAVFEREGEAAYRRFQDALLDEPLSPGVALPFIRRILSLNDLSSKENPLVDVIVLSRNDHDTGARVMRSARYHGLDITRWVFLQGKSPYEYMPAFGMSLFLSANADDVREAIERGLPAGQVIPTAAQDDGSDKTLRVAFDFDGVLADDESDLHFETGGLETFIDHESGNADVPHNPGPLRDLLAGLNALQRVEDARTREDPGYERRIFVTLITARGAPTHERAVNSLKSWGVTVNESFFLGGLDKDGVLSILKPHIFFDDRLQHVGRASASVASVHVPFGFLN